jgi:hypothetical protein
MQNQKNIHSQVSWLTAKAENIPLADKAVVRIQVGGLDKEAKKDNLMSR